MFLKPLHQAKTYIDQLDPIIWLSGPDWFRFVIRRVLGKISVLDSPLVLDREVPEDTGSNDSYHTPLVAGSSIVSSSSPSNVNKENVLIIYDSCISLLKRIEDKLVENIQALPTLPPVLDFSSVSCLVMVHGQHCPTLFLVHIESCLYPSIPH